MFSAYGRSILRKCTTTLRLTFLELSTIPDISSLKLVRTIEKIIEPNTSIHIESPVHVKVEPIDVNIIEDHQKLTMKLYCIGKESNDFQVKESAQKLELLNKGDSTDCNDVCLISIPYKLKVNVKTTNKASVKLGKMDGDEFTINTHSGDIILDDMKARTIKLETHSGRIQADARLLGEHIDIKTGGQLGVSCHHIESNNLSVLTHAGPITVKSCYSHNSHFTTAMGNITLDHLHKSVVIDVIQRGNLFITGFCGNLQASLKSGDVFMHASQLLDKSSIFIHEKGKVELLILDIVKNLPAVNLIAEQIIVDENVLMLGRFMDDSHPKRFRVEGEAHNELHIVCKNGSIELKNTKLPFFLPSIEKNF